MGSLESSAWEEAKGRRAQVTPHRSRTLAILSQPTTWSSEHFLCALCVRLAKVSLGRCGFWGPCSDVYPAACWGLVVCWPKGNPCGRMWQVNLGPHQPRSTCHL